MPELPDVEQFRSYFNGVALDRRIKNVDVENDYVLKNTSSAELKAELIGHSFHSSQRHGKNLFIVLDNGHYLRMHFGMTGSVTVFQDNDDVPRHTRVRFDFADGDHLAFADQRMLGAIELVPSADGYLAEHHLGPDAAVVSFEEFKKRLSSKRAALKTVLMDQEVVAGIGNVYSDEILFQSRLHPETDVAGLTDAQLRDLYKSMRRVFDIAIERSADPGKLPRNYLIPNRVRGSVCPRCKTKLKTLKSGGRTAWYCPQCQRK